MLNLGRGLERQEAWLDVGRARKSEEKYASGATSLGTGMTRGSEAMTCVGLLVLGLG